MVVEFLLMGLNFLNDFGLISCAIMLLGRRTVQLSGSSGCSVGRSLLPSGQESLILDLLKHGTLMESGLSVCLVILLFLKIGLFLWTIWSWMTSFTTNRTFYLKLIFSLERTCPSSVTFLLTIFTIVIDNTLNLHIIAFDQFFQLFILFSIEDLLNFLYTFLKLLIVITYHKNM